MFYIPGEDHEWRCECCGMDAPTLWALEVLRRTVQKADRDSLGTFGMTSEPGFDTAFGEAGTDLFLTEELSLGATLANAVSKVAQKVSGVLHKAFDKMKSIFNMATLHDAIEEARPLADNVLTKADDLAVREAVNDVLTKGAFEAAYGSTEGAEATAAAYGVPETTAHALGSAVAPKTVTAVDPIRELPSRQKVFSGIVKSTHYYTNKHFNNFVVPWIMSEVDKLTDASNALGNPDFRSIQEHLDERLHATPYWRVVANAAASRGFHYGMLKTGEGQGKLTYQWKSVIDKRTSNICRRMNGHTFYVADAVDQMEAVADADSLDAVKKLAPWPRWSDIKDLNAAAIAQLGVRIPPAHGNCRSTIIFLG